ncbi:MAG: hypothetical protein E4G98_05705, partial [Promethearchaeota archaeon]
IGFIYYILSETNKSFINIFFMAWGIRSPMDSTDFSGFYQISIAILLDVVVFSFLVGALLEKYNPVATSKIIAEHQRNHTIILGYDHLGERIVEYLQEKRRPYVLIENSEEKVSELINSGEPVIIGDFTEQAILIDAGISNCKEVFFVTNDFRKAIVCVNKIRDLNKKCKLYLRAFEDEFQDYLERDPWNAYTFSTSQWSLEKVKSWTQDKTGPVIVLGFNHISRLVTDHIANSQNRQVILIDPEIDEEIYISEPNIRIIQESYTTLEGLKENCKMDEISQIFICWKSESHFSEALLLIMKLKQEYPKIEAYVRIYDEETIPIFQQYNVETFSTSSRAFEMLQKEVDKNSGLRK